MNFNIPRGSQILFFLLLFVTLLKPVAAKTNVTGKHTVIILEQNEPFLEDSVRLSGAEKLKIKIITKIKEKVGVNKGTALLILLLTGPLGGHRIYLGTSMYVPIAYTLTIGGGFGVLPLIDAFVIIFTDDLSKYINNDKVIMWIN